MKNFENVKSLTIKDLKESGKYSQELLESLTVGKYQELYALSISDRANRDFMEPLLYAVKNEMGTYAVYTYYSENLQDDIVLATQIIQTEPELIEGTPISKNKQFIIEHVDTNPEIISYMSPALKSDIDVIEEICRAGNAHAIEIIGKDTTIVQTILGNPELSDNKEFMASVIEKSGEALAFASQELKNDYEFLKDAYKTNIEAIDYTAEHTQEFGEKGLLAAKEVIIETTSDNAIKGFEAEISKVREQLEICKEEPTLENADAIKKLEMDEKRFQRHIKFIQRIKSGEVDQVKAAERINKYCRGLAPEYRKRLEQMLIIDTAMKQKQQEGEKQVSKEDIGEVARNFGEMDGQLPQGEMGELKRAIEEPVIESENSIENDAPDQK